MTQPINGLVDAGPCPHCGNPQWLVAMCACAHPMSAHTPNTKGVRKACTSGDTAGQCPCTAYTPSTEGASA